MIYILAGVVPALYYVALQHLPPVGLGLTPRLLLSLFFLWIVAPAIFGFVLGGRRARPLLAAVSVFGGICLGVIANATYDSYSKNIDSHNLLPFEILLGGFVILPGIMCGWAAGQLRYRRRHRPIDAP
jgi:hypothetical protein